jgi:hypothetical protein
MHVKCLCYSAHAKFAVELPIGIHPYDVWWSLAVCASADWRHSVRSARSPARLSTWTNCTTLIGWRYRTKANTPWCSCKWVVIFGINALSVLTSGMELFSSCCLLSFSYSLPRRLHSFLLVASLCFSLCCCTFNDYSSFSHLPPSFYSFSSLFYFSALFSLLRAVLLDMVSVIYDNFRFTDFVSVHFVSFFISLFFFLSLIF